MPERAIALGFFDGVHLGHGALLREAAGKGRACRARADDGGIVLHGASSLALFFPSA